MKNKTQPNKNKNARVRTAGAGKQLSHKPSLLENRIFLLVLILFVTFVAFIPSLNNGFIETWDDAGFILDNAMIKDFSWNNIRLIFTKGVNSNYIPLIQLSWMIEYQFFGLDPFMYHLDNVLLHLLCTAFVFYILLKLRLPLLWAAFAALFFGVQPMRVESIAWATERKDLLYSVFYLPALLTYYEYLHNDKRKWMYFLLTFLLFTLSLFSKIQAVALPLTLLLMDYYYKRPLRWMVILEKIPYFILSIIFGIIGYQILGQYGALEVNDKYSLLERALFGLYSLTIYTVKFVFPYVQSALYPYPIGPGDHFPLFYYLNPLLLMGLGVLVILTFKRTRAVIFGVAFYLINIVFVLQIVAAGSGFLVDRYTYIPYIGLWFLAFWWISELVKRQKKWKAPLILALSVLGVIYAAMTFERVQVWKNTEVLWSDVIKKYPGKLPTAYTNRASFYRKAGKPDLALADYDYAISLDKKDGAAWMNRGNIHFDRGNDSLAFRDYMQALARKVKESDKISEIHKLYGNLGGIYGRQGKYDSAFYYLDLSLKTDSTYSGAYLNRGVTYEATRQFDRAITDFQHYLRYNPGDDKVYSDIGVCFQNLGRFEESLKWFAQAILLKPDNGFYYLNRSFSYNAMKEKDKAKLGLAREDVKQAMKLGANIPPDYLKMLGL